MTGFSSVLMKEFMHLRRDPATLIIAMVLPFIQLIIFGYAINFDVRHIPMVVTDMDRSRESREYISKLVATQYLDLVAVADGAEEAAEALRTGSARVAVTIPPDFSRMQLSGRHPQVGVMIDGSDAQVSLRARSAFLQPVEAGKSPTGAPDVRIDMLFNPTGRTANFMIPGLIAVILGIVTTALTAFSIVREKEQGTLEQIMVTPVGRLALMLGKILPYAVLALGELLVVVFAGIVVFGVSPRGSILSLTFMSAPYILACLALGLLISTVAQTQGQALQMTMLTLMPSILLSGYVSPRETMPGWLYLISDALPATYFIQITRGILIRGAGFMELLGPFISLIAIAAVFILLSTARFRKSIA